MIEFKAFTYTNYELFVKRINDIDNNIKFLMDKEASDNIINAKLDERQKMILRFKLIRRADFETFFANLSFILKGNNVDTVKEFENRFCQKEHWNYVPKMKIDENEVYTYLLDKFNDNEQVMKLLATSVKFTDDNIIIAKIVEMPSLIHYMKESELKEYLHSAEGYLYKGLAILCCNTNNPNLVMTVAETMKNNKNVDDIKEIETAIFSSINNIFKNKDEYNNNPLVLFDTVNDMTNKVQYEKAYLIMKTLADRLVAQYNRLEK